MINLRLFVAVNSKLLENYVIREYVLASEFL